MVDSNFLLALCDCFAVWSTLYKHRNVVVIIVALGASDQDLECLPLAWIGAVAAIRGLVGEEEAGVV